MILINLLPHRELARKRAASAYNGMVGLAAVIGALMAGVIYLGYTAKIDDQQARNEFLTAANTRLDKEIKNVADLQSEITALKERQQAVESLQANRNLPVHLFNGLVGMLPSGMVLDSIKQDGDNILITGIAQSQDRVSELLRNLSSGNNPWITKPELIEIKAEQLALSPRDQRRVFNFTIRSMLGADAAATPALNKTRGSM